VDQRSDADEVAMRSSAQRCAMAFGWAAVGAMVALLVLLRAGPADAPTPIEQTRVAAGDAAAPAEAGDAAADAAAPDQRREVAPPEPGDAALDFDGYVARLLALGQETTRLAAAGATEAAKQNDERARALFDELTRRIADADERALAALCGAPAAAATDPTTDPTTDPATDPTTDVTAAQRAQVLALILQYGLRRRLAAPDRAPLDALVAAVLAALPGDAGLARRLGLGLLADEPYLDLPHEQAVLSLAQMSGDGLVPSDVATALLTTLWHNLQRAGRRSSDELATLCLLLLGDGNAGERLAACRQLLGDPRYRLLVLEHLRTTPDARLAREVALAAVQDLPPAEAFTVVVAAATAGGAAANADHAPGAVAPFLALGHRDPQLLQREYEQRLADDVEPRLRELLVAGAGFGGDPAGIELARLAFDADPDPEVRLRALFVLTGRAADALGEGAMARALDDPRIRDDPRRLSAVVLALENLARRGLVNAVDRIGRRLRACALDASSRQALEATLASALPGAGR
jgi:hypothetical protein